MNFDLGLSIGLLLLICGLILLLHGLLVGTLVLDVNINLWLGAVVVVFGSAWPIWVRAKRHAVRKNCGKPSIFTVPA
jgi:hypothetical protein